MSGAGGELEAASPFFLLEPGPLYPMQLGRTASKGETALQSPSVPSQSRAWSMGASPAQLGANLPSWVQTFTARVQTLIAGMQTFTARVQTFIARVQTLTAGVQTLTAGVQTLHSWDANLHS